MNGNSRDRSGSGKRPPEGERRDFGKKYDDRPHGERRFDDHPRGERRFDDRPKGEPRDFGKKYGDRPRGDRRFDDRPYGERRLGDRPKGERRDFGKKYGDHPHGERRFDDRPYGERRFDDRPKGELRDFGKKYGDHPHGERRFDDRPYGERRFDDRPKGEPRDFGKKYGDRPHGERRFDDHPRGGMMALDRRAPLHNPTSARDAALLALDDVVRRDAYAAQALDRALSAVRLSGDDRRLAASIFYFAVENRLRIENALGALMENKPEPVVADVLHVAAAQLLFMDRVPDHAAVDEAVKQVRAAGRGGLDKLVNGVLRSLIRARDAGELALPDREADLEGFLSVRYSLARPAVRRLVAAYGAERAEQLLAYAPPTREITVRPNRARIGAAEFEALLDRAGLVWRRGAVEDAYIVSDAGGLAALPAYRAGLFSIQSEGSMLAAQAVGARPGMRILDACAAPGGKTCLMAERMGASGRVFAWDVHGHRVELIRAAARRLGLDNVRPALHDARRPVDDMALSMDAVLVDAPCSGLGVMWDKPDIRFRATEESLERMAPLQREILDACAGLVRYGGRLVYSTCTILPEENEAQARAFLERHPEFEPDDGAEWLPEALRGYLRDGMIQLLPDRDGMEGFFIARMRRRRA